jgi:hypothetical protein
MTRLDPNPPAEAGRDAGFAAIEAALSTLAEPAPARLGHATLVAVGLADDYVVIDSPIGPLRVAWNGRGVSSVDGAPDDRAFELGFFARTGRRAIRVPALPPRLARAVERRLAGDRRARIDLDLRGTTEFEQAVWLKALEIPGARSGRTAGSRPRSAGRRRPGGRDGAGPQPDPAHRPVPPGRPDGRLHRPVLAGRAGQQAGDPRRRRRRPGRPRGAGEGRRPVHRLGHDADLLPADCHDARRVTDRHLQRFHSSGEAYGAGYRPCHCRPVAESGAA